MTDKPKPPPPPRRGSGKLPAASTSDKGAPEAPPPRRGTPAGGVPAQEPAARDGQGGRRTPKTSPATPVSILKSMSRKPTKGE